MKCSGRPVLFQPSAHGNLLATDQGGCFLFEASSPDGGVLLPDLQGCVSAVTAPDGAVVASRYTPMVARLSDAGWEFLSLGTAPILALATTPQGVAAGDAAGDVVLLAGPRGRLDPVRLGPPVVELCAYENGLAALGANGALGCLGYEDEWEKDFVPVAPGEKFERPVSLFSMGKQRRVGLIAAERIAILDVGTGRLTVSTRKFAEGIRQVVYHERKPPCYGVLTDAGELMLLEADLTTVRPAALPGDPQSVAGICRGGTGSVLAWTAGGALFSISRDRAVRKLASEEVVLAHYEPDHPDQVLVVRWTGSKGAHVEMIRSEATR